MKIKFFYKIFILFLFCSSISSNASDIGQTMKDDFNYAVDDFKNLGNNLNLSHLFFATQIILADIMVQDNDEAIRTYFKENKNETLSTYLDFTNYFGEKYTAIGLPLLVYGSGLAFDNKELRTTGRLLAESVLLSTLVTQSIKMIAGRTRPFTDLGADNFTFFKTDDTHWSFPSGHTTVAFTMATVLAHRIDTWWSYAGFYALAASTGLSRIHLDKHWASDVFMGAAIGTASALLILSSNKDTNEQNLSVTPSINMFSISYRF